jgi:hypothetical protein
MTDDLAVFLRGRLAEDEVEANKHEADGTDEPGYWLEARAETHYPCNPYLRISKARALAEVDAKRRILVAFEQAGQNKWPDDPDMILTVKQRITNQAIGREDGLMTAIRLLVLPYADHPDYRPEWRPDGEPLAE